MQHLYLLAEMDMLEVQRSCPPNDKTLIFAIRKRYGCVLTSFALDQTAWLQKTAHIMSFRITLTGLSAN
ncbi:hypothetical protein [Hymenobacter fodinae]|uniref:Uncharacterized protein n=1 Tax=Hymenobacter fodinae TaxID=2510796 RepID=A0A4Z0P3N6_9BACT|nr:hypothetical protein [Hymenobacter fodinae]TGE05568.1 hypothetical protein EU556_19910 [Hymenobacter fodinae]